jgi:hypothetical protein
VRHENMTPTAFVGCLGLRDQMTQSPEGAVGSVLGGINSTMASGRGEEGCSGCSS